MKIAYVFRDAVARLGLQPIIIADAPKSAGAWTPEDKVNWYMRHSHALIALCTPDDTLSDGTWQTRQNIIDELGRARTTPGLRKKIIVVKEPSVGLPSNIDPVYEHLDLENPEPTVKAVVAHLVSWGLGTTTVPRRLGRTDSRRRPPLEIVEGLRPDDPQETQLRIRRLFREMSKRQQRAFISRVLRVIRRAEHWEHRAIAANMLETVVEIDAGLLSVDVIEELSRHSDFFVRSSMAVIMFILACTSPGSVPVDIATRLARPASEDWYVYMPTLSCLKQLAFSRPEATAALLDLARSEVYVDREYAAAALRDIAAIKPEVIPLGVVGALSRDKDSRIREIAAKIRDSVLTATENQRRHPHSPFTPF